MNVVALMELFHDELCAGTVSVVQLLVLTVNPPQEVRFWLRFYERMKGVMQPVAKKKGKPAKKPTKPPAGGYQAP